MKKGRKTKSNIAQSPSSISFSLNIKCYCVCVRFSLLCFTLLLHSAATAIVDNDIVMITHACALAAPVLVSFFHTTADQLNKKINIIKEWITCLNRTEYDWKRTRRKMNKMQEKRREKENIKGHLSVSLMSIERK